MALNRKTSPTGVDKLIDKWQKLLYDGLTSKGWLDYESYPRGYPNVDSKDGNKVKAEHFTTSTDYKGVLMDDGYAATSFFLVSGTDGSGVGLTQSTISVIFQTDLKKLYTTSLGRFDEELINDIKAINKKLDGRFQEGAISRTIDEVYTEFDTDLIKKGAHNHEPYNVVRFDMTVTYQHSCADEYARGDCTVKVSVSTTAETSIGANNGTATANVTGDQGNLTYLWTTTDGTIPSGEEIKQTATGLSPASYSVLVTDDNAISCTASASGTVQEGQPLPTCNLVIEDIVATGTTEAASDGTATVTVSGLVGSAVYNWEDGQTTSTAIGLPVGFTSVAVGDSGVGISCTRTQTIRIPNSNGNYIFFDKVNDWADLTQLIFAGDWTFQAEFQANDFGIGRVIFSGTNNWGVRIESSTTVLVVVENVQRLFTVPTMTAGVFYRLHITNDDTSGDLRLYINGVESTTGALSGGSMRIDRIGALSSGSRPWGGGMDNIGLEPIVASASQISSANLNPANFITIMGGASIFYNANQTGDATQLLDTSGNNIHATLSGYVTGAPRFETRDEL